MKSSDMVQIFGEELLKKQKDSAPKCAGGYSACGICPRAYEDCDFAQAMIRFENVCSKPQRYIKCILNLDSGIIDSVIFDSGIIEIPAGARE